MSKPWDTLRTPVPSPIGLGTWVTYGGTYVQLVEFNGNGLTIRINGGSSLTKISSKSAREIGEFLIELADQIEGKNDG